MSFEAYAVGVPSPERFDATIGTLTETLAALGNHSYVSLRAEAAGEEVRCDLTEKVLSYAVERARLQWPGQGAARVVMAYKFHLLASGRALWTPGARISPPGTTYRWSCTSRTRTTAI
ncbi:hypothetical protein EF908_12120 [Streptomyces sp. WAC04770]|nr:hypothetical protein [Streptomyces sp. WAC04770]RST23217.1 hypothetical protein EF908_12120 [Streptomyces sp. WAC04770]